MSEFTGLFELLTRAENYQSLPWKGHGDECSPWSPLWVQTSGLAGLGVQCGVGAGLYFQKGKDRSGWDHQGLPLELDLIILQISKA